MFRLNSISQFLLFLTDGMEGVMGNFSELMFRDEGWVSLADA